MSRFRNVLALLLLAFAAVAAGRVHADVRHDNGAIATSHAVPR